MGGEVEGRRCATGEIQKGINGGVHLPGCCSVWRCGGRAMRGGLRGTGRGAWAAARWRDQGGWEAAALEVGRVVAVGG